MDPKKKCFKWLLILNRLPIRNEQHDDVICNECKVAETARHIFFDGVIAREIWLMFGFSIPIIVDVLNIISSHIHGIKKDSKIFWFIVSCDILWYIWKIRNEDKYQDKARVLTESFRRLTYSFIMMQVTIVMCLEKRNFERFL